jgi:guanylate kinase
MWIYGWGDVPGPLVVISGPSGSGKSTIIRAVLERPDVTAGLSVSATTRAARVGETHGVDYYFMSVEAFRAGIERQEFLEYAEYNDNLYGTPAEPVRKALAAGRCVLLEIETQGAMQVRKRAPEALFVFVNVPRFADLARRLRARGTETEQQIHNRLVIAREERDQAHRYDVVLDNDDLDRAVDELARLIKGRNLSQGN